MILSASGTGTIRAADSANDMLTLLFTTPLPGGWTGFDTGIGQFFFGDVVFGGLTGSLLGAQGVINRVSGPAVPDPPDPSRSATVPELSTWTMMLVGLAALGLAKGRRALAFLGGRA